MELNGPEKGSAAEELTAIASSLDRITKDSETSFMKIGGKLQSIYSDATGLSRQTREAVGLIGGDADEGLASRVGVFVENALAMFNIYKAEASYNLSLTDAHVGVVKKHLNATDGLCDDLKKTAKFLKLVGLHMRMECSRTPLLLEMFSVVSNELQGLSTRIMEIAETIGKDSASALEDQVSAQARTSEAVGQLFTLASAAENTVRLALARIEQVVAMSVEVLSRVGAVSQKISDHVGDIVMRIQFHDNMRQRIEHITKAIFDMEGLYSKQAGSVGPETIPSKELATTYFILELQKSQLSHIIDEITAVHQKTAYAFDEIANEVSSLTQGLFEFEQGLNEMSLRRGKGAEDPFEALVSGLKHLYRMIDKGLGLIDDMHKTAEEASDTIGGLSSYMERVRGLAFETHLAAINAMVKTKKLGKEGLALNSLVREATVVSEHSNMFVNKMDEIRNAINASVIDLKSRMKHDVAGPQNSGETQTSFDTIFDEITQGGTQFKEDSSLTLKQAGTLKEAISGIGAELDFLPCLATALKGQHRQLEDISLSFNIGPNHSIQLTEAEIQELQKRYTMREERSVHERFLGQTGTETYDYEMNDCDNTKRDDDGLEDGKPYRCGKTGASDDLGDNVELF